VQHDPLALAAHGGDLSAGVHRDALVREDLGQQRGGVRIDTGQQPLGGFHKGHGDAEPSERLGQFAAHRATAEDGQRFGWISQVEGGLGGQVRRVGEPDRWHGRTRAGGDDDPTAPQAAAVDNNGVRARESGPSAQHVDPLPAQHLRGLSGRDPGDRGADPRQRVAERHSMRGGVDERLGRHASGEGAVPADLALGHQQHPHRRASRGARGGQPCGTASDHHHV
jgi:hypothetical protein